jgi:hypothetical protein
MDTFAGLMRERRRERPDLDPWPLGISDVPPGVRALLRAHAAKIGYLERFPIRLPIS